MSKTIDAFRHDEATRRNIPTAEHQAVLPEETKHPVRVAYDRRNRDLDPQLVWRGKDEQDWSDLVVQAPPLYIQEKVHPKALIDDLLRESREREHEAGDRDQARALVDQALRIAAELPPEDRMSLLGQIASAAAQAGDRDQARALVDQALQIAPELPSESRAEMLPTIAGVTARLGEISAARRLADWVTSSDDKALILSSALDGWALRRDWDSDAATADAAAATRK